MRRDSDGYLESALWQLVNIVTQLRSGSVAVLLVPRGRIRESLSAYECPSWKRDQLLLMVSYQEVFVGLILKLQDAESGLRNGELSYHSIIHVLYLKAT